MQIFTFKRTAVAMMAAAFLSPVAMADIGGGGATLPAKAYAGSGASTTATGPRQTTPAPGSLLYEALPSVAQTYCQTGSGGGRNIISGSGGFTNAALPCPPTFAAGATAGVHGFGAPSVDADFAGSDEPANSTIFANFAANKSTHTQMTQFPSIAGLIAVIANSPGATTATVYLTEAEVCNVFSGRISNWNQLARNTGAPFPSKPIKIVYRSDGSGTSFSFSNHLNRVCQNGALAQTLAPSAATLPWGGTGQPTNFSVNGTFSAAFPGGVVPAGAIGASGNPAVVQAVNDNDGSIGYAESANATDFVTTTFKISPIAAVESISELDPTDGTNTKRNTKLYVLPNKHQAIYTIPSTFVDVDGATYSSVYTGRSLQSNNATFLRPVGVPSALPASSVPVPNCVFLVHPGAYATAGYKTAGSPISGYAAYPITAITYLLGNYNANGNAADMKALMGSPLNASLRSSQGGPVTTIGTNTGFAYLSLLTGTALNGASILLNQARVSNCTN